MEQRVKPPTSLDDFKGNPPRVRVSTNPKNPADFQATQALIDFNTQEDGFHCPWCQAVITNPDEIVNHLAEEINKAMAHLGKRRKL